MLARFLPPRSVAVCTVSTSIGPGVGFVVVTRDPWPRSTWVGSEFSLLAVDLPEADLDLVSHVLGTGAETPAERRRAARLAEALGNARAAEKALREVGFDLEFKLRRVS